MPPRITWDETKEVREPPQARRRLSRGDRGVAGPARSVRGRRVARSDREPMDHDRPGPERSAPAGDNRRVGTYHRGHLRTTRYGAGTQCLRRRALNSPRAQANGASAADTPASLPTATSSRSSRRSRSPTGPPEPPLNRRHRRGRRGPPAPPTPVLASVRSTPPGWGRSRGSRTSRRPSTTASPGSRRSGSRRRGPGARRGRRRAGRPCGPCSCGSRPPCSRG